MSIYRKKSKYYGIPKTLKYGGKQHFLSFTNQHFIHNSVALYNVEKHHINTCGLS